MLGNASRVTRWSNKVHPATAEMLNQYPMRELVIYAEQLGVQVTRNKPDMVTRLVESGKATICGSLGN